MILNTILTLSIAAAFIVPIYFRCIAKDDNKAFISFCIVYALLICGQEYHTRDNKQRIKSQNAEIATLRAEFRAILQCQHLKTVNK